MASKPTRRGGASRMAPKSSRPATLSVDKLADQLTSGLSISDAKGKQKAPALTEEQARIASMRAVNSASQALSTAVQSGWKQSIGKPTSTKASVTASSAAATKHLAALRELSAGDIDVERAAMSVLGKLVALEMALTHTETTLAAWIPHCTLMPPKQLDSLLTRAYSNLTKSCATSKSNFQAVFSLRMYALVCLAHTSAGTIEPSTFWDQVVRFGGAFVKSQSCAEKDMMLIVLFAFSDLAGRLGKRSDGEFFAGKGFAGFCEYWMAFAKKGISLGVSSSSKHGNPSPGNSEDNGNDRRKPTSDRDSLESARLCAIFAQATTAMEQESPDTHKRVHEATASLKDSQLLLRLLPSSQDDDADRARITGKLDRALERLRRATIATLDSSTRPTHDASSPPLSLLQEIASSFEQQCTSTQADADVFTRALDTLFVLARTQLLSSDPRTYIAAHDTLTRASRLVEPRMTDDAIDAPNYVRCISGAFHNIAGTLYQAGRHGSAIGFLKDACALGLQALKTRRKSSSPGTDDKDVRAEEGWKQLEEQLYRRWELLGVAYSKIGDRKEALQAFINCIKTFPYTTSGFTERAAQIGHTALFDISSGTKQLATLVDRVSHLSACELLMEPTAVSLASLQGFDSSITGALLERQIDSLETSRSKEGISEVTAHLLKHALKAYSPDMPVRRARVLLRCMDFTYHAGPNELAGIGSPDEMGAEIDGLLQSEDFGKDASLAVLSVQYRAAAHLWRGLHAHRRMDPKQTALVAHHSEEACTLLKTALSEVSAPKSARKSSPKQIVAPKKPALGPPTRQRSTRKAVVTREPVTPKPKSRKALQPVSLNTKQTPPRQARSGTSLVFDDLEKLLSLLQLASRISGLLTLTLPKVHLLDVSRRLSDRQLGIQSDGYVISSVDLAYEYQKLGKVRRAATIFNQALNAVRSGKASDEACTSFFLRFSESLALAEDIPKSEALTFAKRCDIEEKGLPTIQRIRIRVGRLERAALASHVFALIQYSKEDVPTALKGMLQSLRLWNRAIDTLTRLNPTRPKPPNEVHDNPFEMSNLKNALPTDSPDVLSESPVPTKTFLRRASMDGLEWRISEGLLATLFSLCQVYLNRGSAREADYFAQQAQDLAASLNAPTMVSRALAKKGEVQLYQGRMEASLELLTEAAALLENTPGFENVDMRRLRGMYNERLAHAMDANKLYEEGINMIEELDRTFRQFDGLAFGYRTFLWLLRDRDSQDYAIFLDKFLSLPPSSRTKAEENVLMAKLTLHAVYARFRGDMFLSSLAESTIALPMGMSRKTEVSLTPPPQDILTTLDAAEKLFWESLAFSFRKGNVPDVRDAIVSLALVQAFQASLGNSNSDGPSVAASLLDASSAITLRREMLETIEHKFPLESGDDIEWPLIGPDGTPQPPPQPKSKGGSRFAFDDPTVSDDDSDESFDESSLKSYWASIRSRYEAQTLDPSSLSSPPTRDLPSNWTVVHINVTADKSTLFISRQECGDAARSPLVFCVPLKGRRDNGEDDEDHLTFEDAVHELRDIVRLSDEGTKAAVHIKSSDHEARAAWWKERGGLDIRLRELLENVEFCWLGAFKTILNPRPNLTPDLISDLRTQFEKVFHRGLYVQDKKSKVRPGTHKKSASQSQNLGPSQVTFDDALLECFSTLSPKCRDEELEDLVYFVLDLYQFHGVPVAIAEVDVIQVVVDLRAVLEEHVQKLSRRKIPKARDEHLFLVLDKNLQGMPWESIPTLRGRSVSRIPSVDFLLDRVLFSKWKREGQGAHDAAPLKGAVINPRKGFYILNPSGDLGRTEERFMGWVGEMKKAGWDGITGRAPSEQQFLNALRDQDLVVYFGHGGGEQYLRSHKIRNLPTCAATMLWGCSSGALRDMGDFDRVGTPYNYMLAGW
ncbi:hypothetical protein DXG03_008867 [Asterophora parasitica]|uniref:separase n=1 Tax=Asterophora parasitica TaxID=117018 RepID=A0A9P7KCJ0_9AGAR|nr:hypothetical protein DXG03_008867 [Asterophora parasitica]